VIETFTTETAPFEGRRVGEIARKLGKAPFDALLDIVTTDELRTGLRPPIKGDSDEDWKLRAEVCQDPRAVVGASDAGAHLDMICGAIYSTTLLGEGVRARGVLSIEKAVQLLADAPARLYGLRDRGRLAVGCHADVVLFDPDRVGARPERTREDLPGGAARLYSEADGIEAVLVAGQEVVKGGEFTGDTPGSILRSGRDTQTVSA
jgi:N-acyl-D-aspartate/D-glutamate deacylase